MFRRFLIALLVLGTLSSCLFANEKRQGSCATAAGTQSLGCTVTVYLTGTTQLAQIYADNANTPKNNPFTADANTGVWFFYASNGRLDIRFSGGNPSITPAFTQSDLLFQDLLSLTTGTPSLPSLASQSANVAQSGFILMAPGDCLSWRNNGNTADNCLTENATDQLAYQGSILPTVGSTPLPAGNCVQAGPNNTLTTISGACSPPISGTVTFTATPSAPYVAVWTGASSISSPGTTNVSIPVANNIVAVDGSQITTLSAALALCPNSGCVIDMRGNASAPAIGTFDPGNKQVTLLLGPYTYSVHQITLRSGFNIIGTGKMFNETILQSDNTSVDVFVLGGSTAISGDQISGFRLYCGSGNSAQIGFHIVAQINGGGLEYSRFSNIAVGFGTSLSCGGGSFLFDGNAGGSPPGINQFLYFDQIEAYRTNSGAPAFLATGLNGQFSMQDVQFDGQGSDTGKINFQVDGGSQTFRAPYTFFIQNGTFQKAPGANGAGIRLQGVSGFTCTTCHFENDNGGIWSSIGSTFGSWAVSIDQSTFDTGTGIDSGNGFITKTDANSSISFDNNGVAGTPDTCFAGTTTYVFRLHNINIAAGGLSACN